MLILTRETDQGIVIGENVTVEVIEIVGSRVKLGITAPDGYSIVRAELREGGNDGGEQQDRVE